MKKGSPSASRLQESKVEGHEKTGKVLVLDLDETLVYAWPDSFVDTTNLTKTSPIGGSSRFLICKRPGVKEFITKMSTCYTLVLFTTGIKEYAKGVLKTLQVENLFSKVLHRGHCEKNSEGKHEKDISKLGVPLSDVIFVDDSPYQARNQPSNTLLIKPFRGEGNDDELSKLGDFLEEMAKKEDVRPVMEAYIDSGLRIETDTTPNNQRAYNLKTSSILKCMQRLKQPSLCSSEECDANDSELKLLLRVSDPQKSTILGSSSTMSSTTKGTKEESPTFSDSQKIPSSLTILLEAVKEKSAEGKLAEPLPVMATKSQFSKLKENRIVN